MYKKDNTTVILQFLLKKKTSLCGSTNIKKVFLSSTQLTEQSGLCSSLGVYPQSHRVIKFNLNYSLQFFFIKKNL